MRESKPFAARTEVLANKEIRRKYILVFEGKDTERIYFEALERLRVEAKINPLIDLVPLLRSFDEEGWSNPKKILDRLLENISEIKTGTVSYTTFLGRIMDYLIEERYIINDQKLKSKLWESIQNRCVSELQIQLVEDVLDMKRTYKLVIDEIANVLCIPNVVNDIPEIVKTQNFTYIEGYDKICLVIDRDRGSFRSDAENNQYSYVLDKCREKGMGFFLTNPCFEFWLLLHFNDVHSLDQNKLLQNVQVNNQCRYVEYELRRLLPGFSKSHYNAELLIRSIDNAIHNELSYCEDEECLENKLGSRVGLLIKEMQK